MFKIFASGVNFSKNNAMFLFLSLKLLKFGEIDGVKFLAWKSCGVNFLTNSMSDEDGLRPVEIATGLKHCGKLREASSNTLISAQGNLWGTRATHYK